MMNSPQVDIEATIRAGDMLFELLDCDPMLRRNSTAARSAWLQATRQQADGDYADIDPKTDRVRKWPAVAQEFIESWFNE